MLRNDETGRGEIVLVDERPDTAPDHGPFDHAEQLPPDVVDDLLALDPAAVLAYGERLRWHLAVYGRAHPDWWAPCPACRGERCLWCDGIGRMHPTRAGWADQVLPLYGPDVAQFHRLLAEGKLDTPSLRTEHLSPGNLRAVELADIIEDDPRFGAYAELSGEELRRAQDTFEQETHLPHLVRWWDPADAEARSERSGRELLYAMYLRRLRPWAPKPGGGWADGSLPAARQGGSDG